MIYKHYCQPLIEDLSKWNLAKKVSRYSIKYNVSINSGYLAKSHMTPLKCSTVAIFSTSTLVPVIGVIWTHITIAKSYFSGCACLQFGNCRYLLPRTLTFGHQNTLDTHLYIKDSNPKTGGPGGI